MKNSKTGGVDSDRESSAAPSKIDRRKTVRSRRPESGDRERKVDTGFLAPAFAFRPNP